MASAEEVRLVRALAPDIGAQRATAIASNLILTLLKLDLDGWTALKPDIGAQRATAVASNLIPTDAAELLKLHLEGKLERCRVKGN